MVQLMPAGALVTVPAPVPASVTPSENVGAANVAVAVLLESIVIVHVPVPVHPPVPLQPVNVLPPLGAAVSVTTWPDVKFAEHVPVVQLIPAGALVTVPVPAPPRVTPSA